MAAVLQHELLGPREGGRAAAGEQLRGRGDEDLGQRAAGGHEDRVRRGTGCRGDALVTVAGHGQPCAGLDGL